MTGRHLTEAPSPAEMLEAERAAAVLEAGLRRSVTVDVAAAALGCDGATVRALLRNGLLAGHHIGKGTLRPCGRPKEPRGVRVFVDSIQAYQQGHPVAGNSPPQAVERRQARVGQTAAVRAALAQLRALGAL